MAKETIRYFMVCETCKVNCACGYQYAPPSTKRPSLYWNNELETKALSDFLGKHAGQTHVLSFLPFEDAALACPIDEGATDGQADNQPGGGDGR